METPEQTATESRLVPRPKTVATRLSAEELSEVEAAAKRAGKSLADWLRTAALEAARPQPDVNELLLAELAATRFILVNLFHGSANAIANKEPFLPEDVLHVREKADARKHETARKMLREFRSAGTEPAAKVGGAR